MADPGKRTNAQLYVDSYGQAHDAYLQQSIEFAFKEFETLEARRAALLKAYTQLKDANAKDRSSKTIQLARLQHQVNKAQQDALAKEKKAIRDEYNIDYLGLPGLQGAMAQKKSAGMGITRAVQEAIDAMGGASAGRSKFQREVIARNLLQRAEAAHLEGRGTASSFPANQIKIIIASGLGLDQNTWSKSMNEIEEREISTRQKGIAKTISGGSAYKSMEDIQKELELGQSKEDDEKDKLTAFDAKVKELYGADIADVNFENIIDRGREIYNRQYAPLSDEQKEQARRQEVLSGLSDGGKRNYLALKSINPTDKRWQYLEKGATIPQSVKDDPVFQSALAIIEHKRNSRDGNAWSVVDANASLTPEQRQTAVGLALKLSMEKKKQQKEQTKLQDPFGIKNVGDVLSSISNEGKDRINSLKKAANNEKEQNAIDKLMNSNLNDFNEVFRSTDKPETYLTPDMGLDTTGSGEFDIGYEFLKLIGQPVPEEYTVGRQKRAEQEAKDTPLKTDNNKKPVPLEEQDIPDEFKPSTPQGVDPALLESQGINTPFTPVKIGETKTFYYMLTGYDAAGNGIIKAYYKAGNKKDKEFDMSGTSTLAQNAKKKSAQLLKTYEDQQGEKDLEEVDKETQPSEKEE